MVLLPELLLELVESSSALSWVRLKVRGGQLKMRGQTIQKKFWTLK
jgi:hypothetical protein